MDELLSVKDAADTMDVIRKVDAFYNRLVDPEFEKEHGTLEQVLAVSAEDLRKFNWQDFLNEDALEAAAQVMNQAENAVHADEDETERRKAARS